jgi:hypothetical protein
MFFFLFHFGQAESTVRGRRRKTKFYTGPIWPEGQEPKTEPIPPTALYERAAEMLDNIYTQEGLRQTEAELRILTSSLERLDERKKYIRWLKQRIDVIEDDLEDEEYLLLH